ncbi:hypothetical protein [Faecalibacterium prausnitzii]|uniref:hypothetical protein n=1 Tax=Faecalibacterium prausnitzii TaxID=853 RepID=UPI002667057A|nr:hypothetical protein [Faecalibacterium prausnitzii]
MKNAKNRRKFFFHRLEESFCLEYGSAFDFIAFTGALSGGAPAVRPLPFVKVLSKFRFWKNLFIFFTGKGLFFHEMSAIPSDS